ncbi:hypothetical protein UFOVP1290_333 [uncultured Caudovirales phage]|uniref:Uncharacterized protein n=1 Tax=uncultured Caudovirales phage TaxID=2100421 RepID=A0A6J5RHG2_9CAUD|nr:hypothetical protein UFOVP1290_333 [uncultured Caudovirales phage]
MNKFNKLLKKIDSFYTEAMRAFSLMKQAGYIDPNTGAWVGDEPDEYDNEEDTAPQHQGMEDTGKYMDIISEAERTGNFEFNTLANLYYKALELNAGYNTVGNFVTNMINGLESDDPDKEDIEILLHSVISDLRIRAGGPRLFAVKDSPEIKKQLDAIKQESITQEIQEQKEEAAYTGQKGQTLGDVEFDPTGGVNQEHGAKGKGGGVSFGKSIPLKDKQKVYENEKKMYQDYIYSDEDEYTLSLANKLAEVLSKLEKTAITAKDLSGKNDEDESVKLQIQENEAQNKSLEKERRALKLSLRQNFLTNVGKKMVNDLENIASTRERQIMKEKIALQEYLITADNYIGKLDTDPDDAPNAKYEEKKSREKLINMLSGGNISDAQANKIIEQIYPIINKWKALKIPKTKSLKTETDRTSMSEEKAQQYRDYRNLSDLHNAIGLLGQNINTQRREIKRKIYPQMKKKVYTTLKEYEQTLFQPAIIKINEIYSNTSLSDEEKRKLIDPIAKKLNAELSDLADNHALVIAYNKKAEQITNYWQMLKSIVDPKSSEIRMSLELRDTIIIESQRLIAELTDTIFNPIVKNLNEVILFLETNESEQKNIQEQMRIAPQLKKVRVEMTDPETGEITEQEMAEEEAQQAIQNKKLPMRIIGMNKRKNIIKTLIKNAASDAKVEQIVSEVVSSQTQNAGHDIFQKLLENLTIRGFEDVEDDKS